MIALQTTRLLALDASDLHGLMDREPQIASRVWDSARRRLDPELEAEAGDILPGELSPAETGQAH